MIKEKIKFILVFLVLLAFIASACYGIPSAVETTSSDVIHTRAAETLFPQMTLSAGQTAVAQLTHMASAPSATATATQVLVPSETAILPDFTNTPSPELLPTSTSTLVQIVLPPTNTPVPPTPPPTAPPLPCDIAQIIEDLNVPDGTIFQPGVSFTKFWRLKNVGSCTWNPSYALVFVKGDRMQGAKYIPLQATVRPGETIDLSVQLLAPLSSGKYRGYWMLSNSSGQAFGLSDRADKPFWVDIRVVAGSSPFAYDFAQNMCAATWQSSAGILHCPGDKNTSRGSIMFLDAPTLENGKREDEQALWMIPEATKGGWIKGIYPLYTVQMHDHFMADIGCLERSKGCDVTFYLGYQVPGKPEKNLGTWHEIYDRSIKRVVLDLSDLSGKQVHFILSVTNKGVPADANAFWLVPSIRRVAPTLVPTTTNSPAPTTTHTPALDEVRFAVIGDYGAGTQPVQDVANLIKSWNPDFILTVGDNNYPAGAAETIDWRIGAFYHEFIHPYRGALGPGGDRNRFFPTLGNHDWDTAQAQAYFDYFTLPGNERYYDFVQGVVHFFALDSDYREPDGVTVDSRQALWLQTGLAQSRSIWKLVYMHHPPFTSGERGPVEWLRWPFKAWGATAVLSGHDHFYERLLIDGFPYFIDGLGGGGIYDFGPIAEGSKARYNANYGAMLVVADPQQITFHFINCLSEVVDTYQIVR